jgi:hypothetical protein
MNLFSFFSNAWTSLPGSTSGDSLAHIVNVDGTPMLNESIDIHGNPFGVTSFDSSIDSGMSSFDCGSSFSGDGFNDCS